MQGSDTSQAIATSWVTRALSVTIRSYQVAVAPWPASVLAACLITSTHHSSPSSCTSPTHNNQ